MRNVTLGLIIGAALLVSGSLSLKATENKMKLWYDKPADEWMSLFLWGRSSWCNNLWWHRNRNTRSKRINNVVRGI